MYRRLEYALNGAVRAFRNNAQYAFALYPVLAVSGSIFSVHFVVNTIYSNVITSALVGWSVGVFLSAMPFGCLLIMVLLSTFIYKFVAQPECVTEEKQNIDLDRGFRILVSVVVNVAISGAIMIMIDKGVRDIPVVEKGYTFLLDRQADFPNAG